MEDHPQARRQDAPVENQPEKAEPVENPFVHMPGQKMVHDVDDDRDGREHDAHADGRQQQPLDIAKQASFGNIHLQRIHPQVMDQMLVAEDGAVEEAEHDRAQPAERQQHADVADRFVELPPGELHEQAGQKQDEALPDVAEHEAEHQHEGDSHEQRRIQLLVARHAEIGDQHLERTAQRAVLEFHGNALHAGFHQCIIFRVNHFDQSRAVRRLFDDLADAVDVRLRRPAGNA